MKKNGKLIPVSSLGVKTHPKKIEGMHAFTKDKEIWHKIRGETKF